MNLPASILITINECNGGFNLEATIYLSAQPADKISQRHIVHEPSLCLVHGAAVKALVDFMAAICPAPNPKDPA